MHEPVYVATAELLLSLFSGGGLRRFLFGLGPGSSAMLDELPDNLSKADLAHEATMLLVRHGWFTTDTFMRMLEARPNRLADIKACRRMAMQSGAFTNLAGKHPRGLIVVVPGRPAYRLGGCEYTKNYSIGRDWRCHIALDDDTVSWIHASLRGERAGNLSWVLRDHASLNGVWWRRPPFSGPDEGWTRIRRVFVAGGDEIRMGDSTALEIRTSTSGLDILERGWELRHEQRVLDSDCPDRPIDDDYVSTNLSRLWD